MYRQFVITTLVATSVFGASSVAAFASPDPVPGTPNCSGLVVAISDHYSGADGASGNENASAGPGYFLGSETTAAIAHVRYRQC